ncbi:RNA polymerase sigma factor [Qipengyuania sp.]|uniref:RNA polymerase sigma factor n=1 Tax=Qipengyuania sp. TaxID=2004515 RepID=UPI0035C79CFA
MPELPNLIARVRQAVMSRGWSREDAEDCVQEALIKVEEYERTHKVRSREALLVRSAINLAIDKSRGAGPLRSVAQHDLFSIADATPGPEQIVEQQMRLRHAAAGIRALPDRTRRILLLRRIEELPYAEIARREGMTVAAVEKQVARATLQLTRWMDGW